MQDALFSYWTEVENWSVPAMQNSLCALDNKYSFLLSRKEFRVHVDPSLPMQVARDSKNSAPGIDDWAYNELTCQPCQAWASLVEHLQCLRSCPSTKSAYAKTTGLNTHWCLQHHTTHTIHMPIVSTAPVDLGHLSPIPTCTIGRGPTSVCDELHGLQNWLWMVLLGSEVCLWTSPKCSTPCLCMVPFTLLSTRGWVGRLWWILPYLFWCPEAVGDCHTLHVQRYFRTPKDCYRKWHLVFSQLKWPLHHYYGDLHDMAQTWPWSPMWTTSILLLIRCKPCMTGLVALEVNGKCAREQQWSTLERSKRLHECSERLARTKFLPIKPESLTPIIGVGCLSLLDYMPLQAGCKHRQSVFQSSFGAPAIVFNVLTYSSLDPEIGWLLAGLRLWFYVLASEPPEWQVALIVEHSKTRLENVARYAVKHHVSISAAGFPMHDTLLSTSEVWSVIKKSMVCHWESAGTEACIETCLVWGSGQIQSKATSCLAERPWYQLRNVLHENLDGHNHVWREKG